MKMPTLPTKATAVMLVAALASTAQAAPFQSLSVEAKVTSSEVVDSQPLIREQRYLFKAEFTLDGQSDGILPEVEAITIRGQIAGGAVPDWWIVGIPAATLLPTSKTLWSASFVDPKALLASGITMGIERSDQTYDDLIGNIRYLDVTLKQKGKAWQLEIESTGFFEAGVPDWFITGATELTEVSIGDDIGMQWSSFVEYGGGNSH
ncbi:MAG: hypothetical protein OEY45_05580 [Gammaproteobacteria bacterium]|nr:hypothetical protein [Gammaproteobacteria bacterium]